MKWRKKCWILILAVTLVAIVLRLPGLEQRPMHGDEAVHAVKFADLLEKGDYHYDPYEYHGPTLNYFTLIPARLAGVHQFEELSEFTLRIVPVFFGVMLVLMLLLLTDGLGGSAAGVAAALTAISPALVFYSRYYIQEMLLVCFTFGIIACAYRYTQTRNIGWALLTGLFVGLCHATKETCIIAFGSMLLALLLTLMLQHRRSPSGPRFSEIVKGRDIAVAAVAAVAVSALFYSSFFTNPVGILDSVRTYATYFDRASQNDLHIHPWYYYLNILVYSKYAPGPFWTEAVIVLPAIIGFAAAIAGKSGNVPNANLLRFVAFYTLIMTVVYALIPYKTPWCLLGFFHGMILLAGVGAVTVVRSVPRVLPRVAILCVLVAACLHLSWQAYLGSYRFYADSRNPYVYAHPTTDVFVIAERVEEIAQVGEDPNDVQIHFICPGRDYWPFPWYLRSVPSVGYWEDVTDNVASASIIIASPSVETALIDRLNRLEIPFVPLFNLYKELRPQVELRGYVRQDLWDKYQQHKVNLILSQAKTPKE